jgi:hypothetical protein
MVSNFVDILTVGNFEVDKITLHHCVTQFRTGHRDRPWRRGLVLSSPPATEETEAMGRDIKSHQCIWW